MVTSDTLPAKHLDYALTRFEPHSSKLHTIVAQPCVARHIWFCPGLDRRLHGHSRIHRMALVRAVRPSIWSRISHESQMRMLARYVTVPSPCPCSFSWRQLSPQLSLE